MDREWIRETLQFTRDEWAAIGDEIYSKQYYWMCRYLEEILGDTENEQNQSQDSIFHRPLRQVRLLYLNLINESSSFHLEDQGRISFLLLHQYLNQKNTLLKTFFLHLLVPEYQSCHFSLMEFFSLEPYLDLRLHYGYLIR